MQFLLLVAGLVAVVWGSLLLFRGGLLAGCLAVLLAGCCFGHSFFHLEMRPLPITADRVLWVVLMAQFCLLWRWGRLEPLRLGKTEYVLAALLVVLTASTVTHDWRVDGSQPMSRLLFYYFLPAGLYLVARAAPQSERSSRLVFMSLGLFALYLAVTAIGETRQIWALVWPSYIRSPAFPEFFGRGRGPLLNPAGCGLFQSVGLCAALLLWPRAGTWGRGCLLAAAAVTCYGIYCTLTRSAWIGGALSLATLLALTLPLHWRLTVLGTGALVGCLVVGSQWERIVSFKRDARLSATDTAESAKLRPLLATVAWNMFLDRPLLGCGYGQYLQENSSYVEDRSTDLPLPKSRPYVQHNVWLSLLTETGLAGTLLFTTLLVMWGRHAWRIEHAAAAPAWVRAEALLFLAALAAYGANAMFQDVTLIPMVNMLLFFMAGLTEGLRRYVPDGQATVLLRMRSSAFQPTAGAH
ncbi:MAG TPA: O-antigen ligase family protein [Pirellulales bacterium]